MFLPSISIIPPAEVCGIILNLVSPKAGEPYYFFFMRPGLREALTFFSRPGRKAGPCELSAVLEWERVEVRAVRPVLISRNEVSAIFDGFPSA